MIYTPKQSKAMYVYANTQGCIMALTFFMVWLLAFFSGVIHKEQGFFHILFAVILVLIFGYGFGWLKGFAQASDIIDKKI